MNRESIIIGVRSVLAAMAVGMAGASLFDFDMIRRLADRLSPDGAATSLDHPRRRIRKRRTTGVT